MVQELLKVTMPALLYYEKILIGQNLVIAIPHDGIVRSSSVRCRIIELLAYLAGDPSQSALVVAGDCREEELQLEGYPRIALWGASGFFRSLQVTRWRIKAWPRMNALIRVSTLAVVNEIGVLEGRTHRARWMGCMSCFETIPTKLLEKFSLERPEARVGVYGQWWWWHWPRGRG